MPQKQSNMLAVVVPFEPGRLPSSRRTFEGGLEASLAIAKQAGQHLNVFAIRIESNPDTGGERCHFAEVVGRLVNKLRERAPEFAPSSKHIDQLWSDGLVVVQVSAQDRIAIYREAAELLKRLEECLRQQGDQTTLSLRLGIATYPDDGNTAQQLLDRAYAAAKRAGRWPGNGFCFFSPASGREVASTLTKDVELMRALSSRSVAIKYQPVADLHLSRTIGVEAQPDWEHPELADQSVREIGRSIERMNLASTFNTWLIDAVFRHRCQWSRSHDLRIGIKVSRPQLSDSSLAMALANALHMNKTSASLIEVCIDGRLLVDGTDHRSFAAIRQLADLGVQLTVVDINTELLALDVLTALPFSGVEFAPAMVSAIGRDATSEVKIGAMINLMKALGLRTRSAGATTLEQIEFLKNWGCDEARGSIVGSRRAATDM